MGLYEVLHLLADHVHIPEDKRQEIHTALSVLAEAAGEVADDTSKPEGA